MAPRALDTSRRRFLAVAAAAIGAPQAISLVRAGTGRALAATRVADAAHAVGSYQHLDPAEGAFIEAIVRTMCPADHLTPDGVECGVVAALDRGLADSPASDRKRFARGLSVSARAWRRDSDRLGAAASSQWVRDLFAGRTHGSVESAEWAHDVLSPMLLRACFAEPVYDRYDNRVFWKMFAQAGEISV